MPIPPPSRRALLALNVSPWGDPWWKDREFMLRELAENGWDVLWSQGPQSLWDQKRWRAAPWPGRFDTLRLPGGGEVGIDVAAKGLPLWPGRSGWNKWVARRWAARVQHWMRARGHAQFGVWVCNPTFDDLLPALASAYHAFHINDDWSKDADWSGARRDAAHRLARGASLISAVAPTMLAVLPEDQRARAHILPHGCDLDDFDPPPGGFVEPEDLCAIPHPRIGYFGRVSRKNDLPLIDALVAQRPDWQWIFLGQAGEGEHEGFREGTPEHADWSRLRARPNVHVFGPRARAELPPWLVHMDANVMCYRLDDEGYWTSGFPLKLFEYLAAGRPVVASPLASLRPYSGVVSLATTAGDWLNALQGALEPATPHPYAAMRTVAAANGWRERGQRLLRLMNEIDDKARPSYIRDNS